MKSKAMTTIQTQQLATRIEDRTYSVDDAFHVVLWMQEREQGYPPVESDPQHVFAT